MENCTWWAIAIFALIVLLMLWLHANVVSPKLVSYFRQQQNAEMQQRLNSQATAAQTLNRKSQNTLAIKQSNTTVKKTTVVAQPKQKPVANNKAIKLSVTKAAQTMKGGSKPEQKMIKIFAKATPKKGAK